MMSVPFTNIPPEHSIGYPSLIASRHTPLSIWEVAQLLWNVAELLWEVAQLLWEGSSIAVGSGSTAVGSG